MKNFYNKIRDLELLQKTKQAIFYFSKREWNIFFVALILLIGSTIALLININNHFLVSVPKKGGAITEGILGTPRFINPVLASTDQDRDLSMLVYSGLMRKSKNGEIIPDLAEGYTLSKDGLQYTFTLKDNIYFHDDEAVTVDDVIFTINQIKDPTVRSPKKGHWDGVSIEKIDNKTILFKLTQPYASFIDNTTIGILPEHLFIDSPIELNTKNEEPIGSGPYKFKSLKKNGEDITKEYTLISFPKFVLGEPFIKKLTLKFYDNEEEIINALKNNDIDQVNGISALNAKALEKEEYKIENTVLPRIFGLFFNQNQNQIFTDKSVLKAIDLAIDKDKIVREALLGYAVAIDNPVLPSMINYQKIENKKEVSHEENLQKAQDILKNNNWLKNEEGYLSKTITEGNKKVTKVLEFSISTSSAPELKQIAELIQNDLETIGIKVEIKTFDIGNLNQLVIRPRKYDALLFGQIVNNEGDLFAFWHSSQRRDPGLNIANYANTKVDKILEETSKIIDEVERLKKYAQFEEEINKDIPAVFIYSPKFIYVVDDKLNGFETNSIINNEDRFTNVYKWSIQAEKVWKIFTR